MINILVVAPYKGLAELAREVAKERSDVKLTVAEGNLSNGVHKAVRLLNKKYDVILSRGGTSLLLSQHVNLPVINIEISAYDIIRAVQTLKHVVKQIIIVGFPNITQCANTIRELLHIDVSVYTIYSENELKECLLKIKKERTGVLLCDLITYEIAQKLNMNSILLASGTESIQKAIDDALMICTHQNHYFNISSLYEQLLLCTREYIYAVDSSGKLWYTSLPDDDTLYTEMQKAVEEFHKKPAEEKEMFLYSGSLCFQMRRYFFHAGDETVASYFIRIQNDLSQEKLLSEEFIRCYSSPPKYFIDFTTFRDMKAIHDELYSYGRSLHPVCIYGEKGLYKELIAYDMHKNSPKKDFLFFEIDCSTLRVPPLELFQKMEETYHLSRHGGTLFFHNISCTPPAYQKEIYLFIHSPANQHRYRILASATQSLPDLASQGSFHPRLSALLNDLTVHIPPLREQTDSIQDYIEYFLYQYNSQYGKQIIGIQSEGKKMLKEYSWPGNLKQLESIIKKLVIQCNGIYITVKQVRHILSEETSIHGLTPFSNSELDFSQPLSVIERQIITKVLEEENMNQTQASARLGISRSTMWRLLKK